MANGLYYGLNSGAVLRKLFPKQLNTQVLILIWTIVFILNIVITVVIQNVVIYPVSDFSREGLEDLSYFENCEVSLMYRKNDISMDCYVEYINKAGELRIVYLDGFPRNWFQRARIMKKTDMLLLEDGSVQYKTKDEIKSISKKEYFELTDSDGILDQLVGYGARETIAGIYVAIGVAMLLIEFFIYSVFHRLFRE